MSVQTIPAPPPGAAAAAAVTDGVNDDGNDDVIDERAADDVTDEVIDERAAEGAADDDLLDAAARVPAQQTRRGLVRSGDDLGMATAEYAIATVAAAGFAGLLIMILRSDEVRGLLLGIVRGALSV